MTDAQTWLDKDYSDSYEPWHIIDREHALLFP